MNHGTMFASGMAVLAISAGSVFGSVSITESFRTLQVFASTSSGNILEDEFTFTELGAYDNELDAMRQGGAVSAYAFASQNTLISVDHFSGRLDVEAMVVAGSPSNAESVPNASVVVRFEVSEPTEILFSGSATGNSFGMFGLLQNSDPLFSVFEAGTITDLSLILMPDYEYEFYASVGFNQQGAGGFVDDLVFDLRFIPAPGSLAMLAFGGLAAPRRRR